MGKAFGFIETRGFLGLAAATDAMNISIMPWPRSTPTANVSPAMPMMTQRSVLEKP